MRKIALLFLSAVCLCIVVASCATPERQPDDKTDTQHIYQPKVMPDEE